MADDKVEGVPTELSFVLPRWATSPLEDLGPLPDVEARMALVLQLAAASVGNSSGGPFAAAVFTLGDARVIAAGVNLVLATRAPVAHAEIVAIALAGSRLGTHDLAVGGPDRAGDVVRAVRHVHGRAALGRCEPGGLRRARRGRPRRSASTRATSTPTGRIASGPGASRSCATCSREEAAEILRRYADGGGVIYNGMSVGRPPERG